MRETVLVLDFGGQYNQLIARRVRELHVYCELLPYDTPLETVKAYDPLGIILTGGPKNCLLYTSFLSFPKRLPGSWAITMWAVSICCSPCCGSGNAWPTGFCWS